MAENVDQTEETLEEVKPIRYQWVAGEKVGTVEVFQSEDTKAGMTWVVFESGNRCNKGLIDQMMYKLGDNEPALPLTADFDGVKQAETVTQGGVDPTAGLAEAPSTPTSPRPPAKPQQSPLRVLLEKQAESNSELMDFSVEISLPKKEVYSILRDSFEEADDELTQMIVDKTDIGQIQEQLKDKIADFVKSYYK